MEVLAVREKMLDIAVFRRTFVDPAAGEEEYIFQYPVRGVFPPSLSLSLPPLLVRRSLTTG